jgi:hypothetical protein
MALPKGYYRLLDLPSSALIYDGIRMYAPLITVYVCSTGTCELIDYKKFSGTTYTFKNGLEKEMSELLNPTEKNTGYYIQQKDLETLKDVAWRYGGKDGIRLEGVEGGKRKSKRTVRKRHLRKRKHTSKQCSRH